MSKIYIVATPIGNLEDMTLRAIRTLKEVDVIFAEDTRVSRKLLEHYEIDTPVERYDEHSHDNQKERILELLRAGKHLALITDAGTPAISDPGARLISFLREEMSDVQVVAIPGPSSVYAALSVSGISAQHFEFLGFVPHKKGREKFFKEVAELEHTAVFFESPHRLEKTLQSLKDNLDKKRKVVIAKELTKVHEEIISGSADEISEYFKNNPDRIRGEFVIIISA